MYSAPPSVPASFPYRDLLDGHVNYVQSRHERMEPTADQFVLSVSDGARSSGHAPFHVIIRPVNDEVPELLARNITVRAEVNCYVHSVMLILVLSGEGNAPI